jgi:hypothetical protein
METHEPIIGTWGMLLFCAVMFMLAAAALWSDSRKGKR